MFFSHKTSITLQGNTIVYLENYQTSSKSNRVSAPTHPLQLSLTSSGLTHSIVPSGVPLYPRDTEKTLMTKNYCLSSKTRWKQTPQQLFLWALIWSWEQQMILSCSCENCNFFSFICRSDINYIFIYRICKKSRGRLGKAKWLKIKQCRKSFCYLKGCYSTSLYFLIFIFAPWLPCRFHLFCFFPHSFFGWRFL